MILLLLSKGPSDERVKIIRVTVKNAYNAHKGLLEQELEKHMLYSFTKGR